jgi:hypothetical protein
VIVLPISHNSPRMRFMWGLSFLRHETRNSPQSFRYGDEVLT